MTLTIAIDNLPEDIARMIAHDLEAVLKQKAHELLIMHGVEAEVKIQTN